MKPQTEETDSSRVGLQRVERVDLPEIVRMAESIWRQHFPGIISDEQIDYMLSEMYSLEAITEEFAAGRVEYWFIINDDKRVGFCAFGLSEQEGMMKLHKLYVLPQFQRQGFGTRTLHCIEDQCRKQGCSMMTLAVNKHNSVAINAYRRKGFTILETVAVDIGEGFVMDDYIMEKRLV